MDGLWVVHVHVCVGMCIVGCTPAHMYVCLYVYMYMHVRVYLYAHTHTRTHAHTCARLKASYAHVCKACAKKEENFSMTRIKTLFLEIKRATQRAALCL